MDKILSGIDRFHRNRAPQLLDTLRTLVRDGQKPKAMLITCSDSRMLPDIISSTDPGDLFIVRNVGNIVPLAVTPLRGGEPLSNAASTGAAIEFAIESLGVTDIIVMGHGDCGAMKGLKGNEATGLPYLDAWLDNARPALHRYMVDQQIDNDVQEPAHDTLSKLNVVVQLEHLASYPSIQNRILEGELKLHGWWFDLEEAHVLAFDLADREFKRIEDVYDMAALNTAAAPPAAASGTSS